MRAATAGPTSRNSFCWPRSWATPGRGSTTPRPWGRTLRHLAPAARATTRVGLGISVLVPDQRSVTAAASGIATIDPFSGGRLRACFGTGFTARVAVGQRP
ncbi:LLM class flavin-dependent oxidoreductase [Streptomyces sp. NPDC088350]|uniref:LLM class flavin-dependent oxidoreductase n=1 Tax=Streptomyces sp. NPDC088350 TaxID=3365854 RepID=UPI003814BBCD